MQVCHIQLQHITLIQSCKMNSGYMFIVHELLYSDIQFEITMKSPVAILQKFQLLTDYICLQW